MFDILSEWAGHKVRQPGRRWSACSTGASIRTPHRVTVGMGRHGAESDSLTNRHRGNAGDRSCRTRSCTRIRHSVFSTVPACRRRWCRRPHAWISRRWPSPTTMVSTGRAFRGSRQGIGTAHRVWGGTISWGQGNTEDSVHLLVLARGQEGYRRLSRQMAGAHLSGGTPKDRKGKPRYDLDALTEAV